MANQIKFDVGFNVNKSDLSTLTSALKQVQEEVNRASVSGNLTEELKRAGTAASQLESILNQSWNNKLNQLDLSKVNSSIKSTYGSVSQLKSALENSGASGAAAYNKFASSILNTNIQLKESNKLVKEMATTLGNTFRYGISSRIVNDLVGSVEKAFSYTKQLDTSLNDIRIVTGLSADNMEKFARQANSAASELGASTLDYTNAALIYYQQGLDADEVAARAETTLKAANVTGQTGEEVSEQLTAVWNGYKVTAEETELYVDKLAAVAATTAADLEELSVGMSKVASAANAMGVDFDDLNAQIATIVSVTRQAPESVGTALKTIYARLGDLSVEGGVDEFGVSLGKVSEQMEMMGIQILDQQGNLRNMSEVIAEVAEKWDTWTAAQRQAAAVAMAGKRQYNNLIALFDNWDMYTDALNTSIDAVGTLQEQQDTYMDSTKAHLQQLTTEAQETYDILFNQDDVNDFADALTGLLNIFNNFLDALGGGKEALLGLGVLGARVFNEQIGNGIGNMIINMERAQANNDMNVLKQQVIDAHAAQGDTVSAAAAEEEAQIMQRTLDVQKGLTKEQYNELMNIQQQVGLASEKLQYLEQYPELAKKFDLFEEDSLTLYKERIKVEQEELQIRSGIATQIREYVNQLELTVFNEEEQLAFESDLEDLHKGKIITEKEYNQILNLDLSLYEDQAQLQVILNEVLDRQKNSVKDQEITVKEITQATEGRIAAENGVTQALRDQKEALKSQALEMQKQADIRQRAQSYVQGLSSTVMLMQSVSSTLKVLNDDTKSFSEKIGQLAITLPMLMSSLSGIKTGLIALSVQMGLFETTTAATAAGVKGLTVALLHSPFAPIAAILTVLGGAIYGVQKHFENLKEVAKEAAEESQKEVDQLKEQAQTNKDLVSEFTELKKQYDDGSIAKEELYSITGQLINAYDLESERIHMLTGDYEAVTKAIREKQKAEAEELVKKSEENVKASAENLVQQSRGSAFDNISVNDSAKTITVDLSTGYGTETDAFKTAQSIGQKYFGPDFGTSSVWNYTFGTDPASLQSNLEAIVSYRDELVEALGEESIAVQNLDNVISQFKEGGLEDFLSDQETLLNNILSSSGLDTAETQEEFDANLKALKNTIQKEINEGLLIDSDSIDTAILSYISQLNNSLATQFMIDEEVKERFGEEILALYKDTVGGYDTETQAKLLQLGFDFSLLESNEEEGKKKLEDYITTITGTQNGTYYIPVSLQDQINDTVLKGKDINKGDWESYTANLSNEALDILGEREDFNNKSIGERISLLQQVNELTKENNLLAIQQYEVNREASESVLNDLEAEKERLTAIRDALVLSAEHGSQSAIEKMEELDDKINAITQEEHEIRISLDMEVATDNIIQSVIGDVMTEADQIKAAAESIGEGWIVAAEDVATFAAAFPELMEGMERLEDGSLQLSKEVVNAELEGAQARINANKQVAIEAAEDKIKQLKLQLELLEEEKKILQEALAGEKTKAETETALRDAVANYEQQLLDNGLIAQADALNKAQSAEQEGVNSMINILSGVNDAINIIHENFAKMLTTDPLAAYDAVAGATSTISASSIDTEALEANDFNPDDIDAMINRVGELDEEISKTKTQIASYEGFVSEMMNSVAEADKAASRVQQGLAGKESKSKSSKSSKDRDKELKKLEEEFDRYWDINKALDEIDRELKKIDKDQENLYGKELIRSLKQENELLENQAQLYEQLAAAQQVEAEELRGKLSGYGVTFDASGAITNYAEATVAALKEYNDAITKYNAGLIEESALKVYEKNYEKFKEALERYDELFYTEMKETQEKIDEIRRKQLANNLKAWEVEIQLKLDWKELERDWNDFLTEVSKDFKSVFRDLRVEMKSMLSDAMTYTGSEGTINSIIGAVHDVTGEIDKLIGGGSSSMFESVSQAQEKLKELNTQLLDSGKALHDLWEEAWDNYLEGIDQVADAFDKLLDRFERINDELEFQNKLIELLYGEEAYGLMTKLYEGQEKNAEVQLQSLKTQVDMWKQLFDASGATMQNQMSWSEDQEKYYENWVEAQSKLNDLVIEYIELLKKDYMNTISAVLSQLESFVTGGSTLSYMATQWERISDNASKYYDSVEGAYYIQNLANKIDQSIADTDNLKAQQKLIALREKEINYLREKENLTEYDIKAAELRYQIALKEIALEEAQQNKTAMKLTRNEQGNWSYQYIADETDISNRRQELLDAYNDLYQLASDAYEANLQALQDLQQKYLESAREIYENENLTEEERQQQLLELREWYLEQYRLLSEENQLYRNDLATSGAALLLEIYEQDQEAYQSMTETERELVDALVNANIDDYMELEERVTDNYQNIADKAREVMAETRADWTSGAQTIADLWNKDRGWSVKTQVVAAYDAIQLANQKYKEAVDWCATAVERNFGEEGIVGAIQAAEYETDLLRDKTVEMVNTAIPYLTELKAYVNQIEEAWRSVQDAIRNAIDLIAEYLQKVGEANAAAVSTVNTPTPSPTPKPDTPSEGNDNSGGGGGSGRGGSSGSSGSGNSSSGNSVYYTIFTDSSGKRLLTSTGKMSEAGLQRYTSIFRSQGYTGVIQYADRNGNIIQTVRGFATGGYTGTWGGNDGRLAMLHQKELVLNADDTANFLSAVNTIRDLNSGLNHSIQDAVLNAVARTALGINGINTNGLNGITTNNNSNTDNVFNITAEFPNANNVDEIREAILSLPNMASQFVNSNLR